jgi:ribosome-associated translation inhibitor RaiA
MNLKGISKELNTRSPFLDTAISDNDCYMDTDGGVSMIEQYELIDMIEVTDDDMVSDAVRALPDATVVDSFSMDGGEVQGIFSLSSALSANMNPSETKVRKYIRPIRALSEGSDKDAIVDEFLQHGASVLPVRTSEGKVKGLSLLQFLAGQDEMFLHKKAGDVKRRKRSSIEPGTSLGQAVSLFKDEKNNALRVRDMDPPSILTPFDVFRNPSAFHHSRDRGAGQSSRAFSTDKRGGFQVSNFLLDKSTPHADKEARIKDVLSLMDQHKQLSVIFGTTMITARDILSDLNQSSGDTRQNEVTFVGLTAIDTDAMEKQAVKDYAEKACAKFGQMLDSEVSLKIHIKGYGSEGKEKKYSISATLESRKGKVSVDKAVDWKLKTAVRMAMEKLERRL